MSGNHVRLKGFTGKCEGNRVNEYRKLRDFSLFQLFSSSLEHDLCDFKTQNNICLVDNRLSLGIRVVNILGHACELRALSGEDICFHVLMCWCIDVFMC